jgi:hypothetical protein
MEKRDVEISKRRLEILYTLVPHEGWLLQILPTMGNESHFRILRCCSGSQCLRPLRQLGHSYDSVSASAAFVNFILFFSLELFGSSYAELENFFHRSNLLQVRHGYLNTNAKFMQITFHYSIIRRTCNLNVSNRYPLIGWLMIQIC